MNADKTGGRSLSVFIRVYLWSGRLMQIGIIIVDHGSRRDESNRMLERVAELFAERFRERYDVVEPAHMELAEPSIATAYARCVERGAREVVAFPYMLSPGKHSTRDIPRMVAEAAAAVGARLIHVSAIGADPASESDYARSKAEGEAAVFEARPDAVVLRPSVIFGPEDHFFNRFAAMARISPVVPLVGAGTRFQPVFVGDVAEAVAMAVDGVLRPGAVYELGGPEVKTLRQLIEGMLAMIRRRRLVLDIPFGLARPLAGILQWLPGAPLTVDQVRLLARDNVVSEAARSQGRTLEGMGIEPRSVEAVLPSYIYRFRRFGQYDVRNPA